MFDKLLFIFLVFSPLCYCAGKDIYQYADRFLMFGTMALACLSFLFCKPQRHILPKWPLILLLFLIAKVYSAYHPLSMHGLFNVFFCIVLFYLVLTYAQDIHWLYRAVGIVICLNIAYSICAYYGYNPIFKYRGLPAGFFVNNSDLAGYLILTTPLMAHYARGKGFLIPFAFTAVFLQSWSGILCGLVAGLLLTVRKAFYPLLTVAVVGICIVGCFRQTYSFEYKLAYRVKLWQEVAIGALQRPLSGGGLGRCIQVTSKAPEGAFTAKNEYLEFGWEVGVVLAAVIFGYIFYELAQRYKFAPKSWDLRLLSVALLVFAVSLTVQAHLRNPKISPTLMVMLGHFYILTHKTKEV